MRARLGLNLAAAAAAAGAALTAAALTTATITPAHAEVGWSDSGPDVTYLHAAPSRAEFGSYMYAFGANSIVPPPRTQVTVSTTATSAFAPGSVSTAVFAFAPAATVSAHVAWCEAHFLSYDVTTDSFRGYDGLTHRCIAPK